MDIRTIAILLLVACALAVCGGIAQTGRMASETAQQFAPIPRATADIALDRRAQEAQVTATYIAVLKSEVVSDTKMTHALQRQREQGDHERAERVAETSATVKQIAAWALGVVGIAIAVEVVVMSAWVALAVVITLCCLAWERYRRARAFTPWQPMEYRPALYSGDGWKVWVDPSTGLQANIRTEHPASMDHGQLLIERQIASVKPGMVENFGNTITQALGAIGRYRLRIRNEERHPETVREAIER